ncbi:MAG: phosphoribosyltransferase [Armatimonadota bacterium]
MSIEPIPIAAAEAAPEVYAAADPYQAAYGIEFQTLVHFAGPVLRELHRTVQDPTEIQGQVTMASRGEDGDAILAEMEILKRVANTPHPSDEDRGSYLAALQSIYRRLPSQPEELLRAPDTLCIGIEREGRILAQQMGWLPESGFIPFHAKRIPFGDGLLVGLTEIPSKRDCKRVVIVDGAIASGATVVALLCMLLRSNVREVHLYSVHSSFEGLRAIMRYAGRHGITMEITVGHATAGINSKFYAVDATDPSMVVVGDLGDTITGCQPIAHG